MLVSIILIPGIFQFKIVLQTLGSIGVTATTVSLVLPNSGPSLTKIFVLLFRNLKFENFDVKNRK